MCASFSLYRWFFLFRVVDLMRVGTSSVGLISAWFEPSGVVFAESWVFLALGAVIEDVLLGSLRDCLLFSSDPAD